MSSADLDIETLLRHLGIRAHRRGRKWVALCPDPAHTDSKPSWSIIDSEGSRSHGSHHCFSCKFGGGPWELAAAVWGVSTEDAGKRLRELLGGRGKREAHVQKVTIKMPKKTEARRFDLPFGVVVPEPGGVWFEPARTYLIDRRRVPQWQIDKWGIGYAIKGRLRMRVVLPVYTSGELVTYSARAFIDGIPRYDAGREAFGAKPKRAVYGEPFWTDGDTATIAEGCFSALALERAGFPNVGGILSSELTPGRALLFSRFDRIIVATDPDKAGDAVAKRIDILSRRARVDRLVLPASPDDIPDDELADIRRSFFA